MATQNLTRPNPAKIIIRRLQAYQSRGFPAAFAGKESGMSFSNSETSNRIASCRRPAAKPPSASPRLPSAPSDRSS